MSDDKEPSRDLENELDELIQSTVLSGQTVFTSWIVKEIIDRHSEIYGDEVHWYRDRAFRDVHAVAGKIMRKYKQEEEEGENQLTLPGYRRLQRGYALTRESEPALVPIEDMSVNDFNCKIEQLDSMIKGCQIHKQELIEYRDTVAIPRERKKKTG